MVDRALLEHPRFVPKARFSKLEAWLWMIGEASWKNRRIETAGQIITVERGQLSASYRFMAKKFGWSVKAVRTFLRQLADDRSIVTETGTGQMVITLCNYESYQSFADYKGTREAHQGHTRGTARAQTITPEGTTEETTENTASRKPTSQRARAARGEISTRYPRNGFLALSVDEEEALEDE